MVFQAIRFVPAKRAVDYTQRPTKIDNAMKPVLLFAVLAILTTISVSATGDEDSSKEIRNTSVVESGTYQVIAKRVDAEEKEIYVTMEDGRILELYFSKATKLVQGGKEVPFSALQNGQRLEVQVEKDGSRLKPIAVTILD